MTAPDAVRDPGTGTAAGTGIGYLPGLDGIRAISVLAVVAYHLDAAWARGGFLGVEVFFVVSGFLITTLLLDEDLREGGIDRRSFWRRRARRLLPAVVVLVVAVLAWTAAVLGAGEVGRFRGDALASLLYVQNWHVLLTDEPYFALFGRPSPFLHLWSLAIEEQFYVLWPLVLPAALRRSGRRRTARWVLAAAGLSALAMAAAADVAAPDGAYLATHTRAAGILLGCALAFAWRPDRFRPEIGAAARRTLGWGGVAAAAVLAWQFARGSELDPWTYPWGFLSVDLSTMALIVAVTHPGSALRHRLGSPALAALGRRSYSLYLWHWPVVVFTRPGVDWGLSGGTALLARLAIIAALTELSFRLVEAPFRDGRAQAWLWSVADRASERRLLPVAVATSVVVAVASFAALVAAPAPSPATSDLVAARSPVTIATAAPAPSTTSSTTATTTASVTAPPTPTSVPAGTSVTVGPPATVPTPPPPAPQAFPDITIVGESVTLGAAPELQRVYAQRVQIDAVEGRSFGDGIALVEALAAGGRLTPIVVVHMGTNGAVPDGGLERLAAAVGPDRRLILTTVHVPGRPWQDQVNQAVTGFVQGCGRCALADWHALASREPDVLVADGVHVTEHGARRYVDLMVSATG